MWDVRNEFIWKRDHILALHTVLYINPYTDLQQHTQAAIYTPTDIYISNSQGLRRLPCAAVALVQRSVSLQLLPRAVKSFHHAFHSPEYTNRYTQIHAYFYTIYYECTNTKST